MLKAGKKLVLFLILTLIIVAHTSFVVISPLKNVLSRALESQKKTLSLMLKNEKTSNDLLYIQKSISIAQTQSFQLSILTKQLSKVAPIGKVVEVTQSMSDLASQLPKLLGAQEETHYVIFFLNNYELRPGGGFIGSLGFLTFKNYTLTKFEAQDVYEIDGHITAHFEPYSAVRRYLNQPNGYLRDSNFSPDFSVNAETAIKFLDYVPPYNKNYTAAFGITTSAFEDFLQVTGPIELPDFQTTITDSNFFSITQHKIEDNFFPGSKQKRSILQSLGNSILQRLADIPPSALLDFVNRSISSRNLVAFSTNQQLQSFLRNVDATGELASAHTNWLLPVDANVGVNKLDAVMTKTIDLQIFQTSKTTLQAFKSTYTNPITQDAADKKTYKNYFQLFVPAKAELKSAVLNDRNITDKIELTRINNRTIFGTFIEVPPASSSTITITYELPLMPNDEKLEFKKQIGSKITPIRIVYGGKATKIMQRQLMSDEIFTLY